MPIYGVDVSLLRIFMRHYTYVYGLIFAVVRDSFPVRDVNRTIRRNFSSFG